MYHRHDTRLRYDDTVSFLEVPECDEIAVQKHVERFHDTVDVST
jgi:hypothetical protein